MKKFIICCILLLFFLLGAHYAIYVGGFYIPCQTDETELQVPFRAEGTALQRRTEIGAYAPITLRGVDLSSSMPGYYATQFEATEADYLRWLQAIGEMGANAVRVVTVMDDHFYNAFYTYNTTNEKPIYLLQGSSISDYANNGPNDAYNDTFYGRLVKMGRDLVDIIHGRKNISQDKFTGNGRYRRDVSPWVVGFLVGTEWSPDTVAYTDHSVIHSSTYAGAYYATTEDATPFEAMLAQVMDRIAAYEAEKYGTLRPVGFICAPDCDFLEYESIYARQLQKYAWIDAEHVKPTEKMEAGCFAAYRLYGFCDDFADYLTQEQKTQLAPLLEGLDTSQIYGGYLELLSRRHTMPLIAAGYGFSSSRGALKIGQPPITEREQGERLSEVSTTLEKEKWAGGFISTWQDVWERRTWNTAFAALPDRNYMWHDVQTDGQNYGLMAFEPGGTVACIVDGDPSEWAEGDRFYQNRDFALSARWDAEGFYLLLEQPGLSSAKDYYLPVDLSPDVGSAQSADPALRFSREADFLLCLDGTSNSRLLVWERYDAMRENFLFEVTGDNPFLKVPDEDSAAFVPVTMALENGLILDNLTPESRARQRLGTWGTGKLTHGTRDPASSGYNSLADFCYGEGCVELRLPWLLLNVADPSSMEVHRDYYDHYGVDTRAASKIWIGVTDERTDEPISMDFIKLKGWKTLEWRERRKESYYILQKLWREEGADDTNSGY